MKLHDQIHDDVKGDVADHDPKEHVRSEPIRRLHPDPDEDRQHCNRPTARGSTLRTRLAAIVKHAAFPNWCMKKSGDLGKVYFELRRVDDKKNRNFSESRLKMLSPKSLWNIFCENSAEQ